MILQKLVEVEQVVSLVFRGLQRNGELEVGGVNVGTLAEMADDLYTITQSF